MPRRTKGIFAFFNVGKQRAGKRRRDGFEILAGVLADTRSNILGHTQSILEKPQRHAHILDADVHRRVGIDKGVQREIFVKLIDFAAQIEGVLIPVKITPQMRGLCSINFSKSVLFCGQIS